MAVKDNATLNNVILGFNAAISTDTTTTTGAIIDTADLDGGLTFLIAATAFTDGVYKLAIVEGDAANLSDAAAVSADALIEVGSIDAVTTGVVAILANGGKYSKVGVHSTKRYVRANIVSTGTTTGATLNVLALVSPETLPAV